MVFQEENVKEFLLELNLLLIPLCYFLMRSTNPPLFFQRKPFPASSNSTATPPVSDFVFCVADIGIGCIHGRFYHGVGQASRP